VRTLEAALLVCEAVLAEAMYLLADLPKAQDALFELLQDGALRVGLRLDEHVPELRALRRKYRDLPMSLADACVVRMAELLDRHQVRTLDSGFSVYRRHGRQPLSLIRPE
jgi:predicted nucleic acid-binding protein